jgi:hypothetical protein
MLRFLHKIIPYCFIMNPQIHSAEKPPNISAYDRWEELHQKARELGSFEVTREEAMRIAGVASAEQLTQGEHLLPTGAKLIVNGEKYLVYGYAHDNSDTMTIVNDLTSSASVDSSAN